MAETGYRISEVAEATGFEPTTIRYYERIGLLPTPERTAAGHRLYFTDDVERLKVVARAKTLGLSLEEIREFLSRWNRGACPPARQVLEQLVESKLDDIRHRITDLVEFHQALSETFTSLTERPAPQHCGPDCGCDVAIAWGAERSTVNMSYPPGQSQGR